MPDLKALFWPRSIALVGASANKTIIRGRIVEAVRYHGFDGPIYPISRSNDEIDGMKCIPSVEALPEPVDLAIITIPAPHVAAALEACGEKGVKAAIVISSGFAEERGAEGTARQDALVEIARRYDIAMIGPNAEGFLNARMPLAATFSPTVVHVEGGLRPSGHRSQSLAVVSQSGGVGFSFFHRGRPKSLDFSFVVSMGNEALLDAMDVVDYLVDDEDTGVILMFMEGLSVPAKFAAVAEKAERAAKPLIVAKIGSSDAGASAAASHTASLAGAYRSYQAVFRHRGIVPGEDADHMVDVAAAFAFFRGRLPKGRRVGVVTPSGGAGAWFADICERHGLEVPELDGPTRAGIDEMLPAYGASRNPVDITAQVIFEHGYAPAVEKVAVSPSVDAVLVAGSLSHATYIERDFDNLRRLADRLDKPVIFCAYTLANPAAVDLLAKAGYPCFTNMPNAAKAIAAMADYQAFLDRDRTPAAARPEGWAGEVQAAIAAAPDVVSEHEAKRLLDGLGVAMPSGRLAVDAASAGRAAGDIGFPVAMKVQSAQIPHKTEAGAIALGVGSAEEAGDAFERIVASAARHSPDAVIDGVRVEPMARPGVEVIVGISRDADFGPMLAVGIGGVLVEVLDDVALSPVPISPTEAHALIDRLRARRLLDGVRGAPPSDVDALAALLVSVSELAAAAGDALEAIDLNPVIVHPAGEGLTVADALIVKRAP